VENRKKRWERAKGEEADEKKEEIEGTGRRWRSSEAGKWRAPDN
jgi:hypothetical protein